MRLFQSLLKWKRKKKNHSLKESAIGRLKPSRLEVNKIKINDTKSNKIHKLITRTSSSKYLHLLLLLPFFPLQLYSNLFSVANMTQWLHLQRRVCNNRSLELLPSHIICTFLCPILFYQYVFGILSREFMRYYISSIESNYLA